jgi:D-proline reductase (dithiol) PrdB
LKWPFGHPLGEPFKIDQQRTVLKEVFKALDEITMAGSIIDPPFKWKRHIYN